MKLNCDLGEGFGVWTMGDDARLMPYIDQANIACGFHASDPLTMLKTVRLAKQHRVDIGAHPAYPDLLGFGRRSLKCSSEEISSLIVYQYGALEAICRLAEAALPKYIKPHGALYNDMMSDERVMEAVLQGVASIGSECSLMIQATARNAEYRIQAAGYGVDLLFEAFADRGYAADGSLLPRHQEGAMLEGQAQILQRIEQLQQDGSITAVTGEQLELNPDTLCVHGDHPNALERVKALYSYLSGRS